MNKTIDHIEIADLLRQKAKFDQKTVAIDAWLIASDDYQVLCTAPPDALDIVVGFSVDIEHENLIDILLQEFSAWGGSVHFYKDKATVVGRFIDGISPKIVDISQISIHRKGKTVTYDLPE